MKHLIPTAILLSLLSPLSRAEDLDYAKLYTQSITIKASEIPGFVEVYAGHQLLDARAVRTLSRIRPRTAVLENPGVAGGPKAESWVELVFDLGGPATEILRTSQPFEAVKAIVCAAADRSGRDTAQIAKPTAAVILDAGRPDKEPPPNESIQDLTRRLAPGGITKEEAAQIANAAYRALWGEPGGELKVTKCELNQAKTWEIEVWWDLGLPNGGARMWIHQTGGFERAEYIPGE